LVTGIIGTLIGLLMVVGMIAMFAAMSEGGAHAPPP
jgi:hypothetical protein